MKTSLGYTREIHVFGYMKKYSIESLQEYNLCSFRHKMKN
ncbi:hypothetical protein RT43_GL002106 [Enterococcus italicus DSM 15952]|nr:hypothetical protein RT43_GL002106 [Enterococcus italicus DSM 15952]